MKGFGLNYFASENYGDTETSRNKLTSCAKPASGKFVSVGNRWDLIKIGESSLWAVQRCPHHVFQYWICLWRPGKHSEDGPYHVVALVFVFSFAREYSMCYFFAFQQIRGTLLVNKYAWDNRDNRTGGVFASSFFQVLVSTRLHISFLHMLTLYSSTKNEYNLKK